MRVAVPGTTIGMSVRKLSVAFDDAGVRAAAASARREGVSLSAWLDRAAREALAIEDGLRAVAEWEAGHGVLTPAELATADAIPDRAVRRPRKRRAS